MMEIIKPGLFENTRKWRERNGFTTAEWKMYVKGINRQNAIFIALAYSAGIIIGHYFWID